MLRHDEAPNHRDYDARTVLVALSPNCQSAALASTLIQQAQEFCRLRKATISCLTSCLCIDPGGAPTPRRPPPVKDQVRRVASPGKRSWKVFGVEQISKRYELASATRPSKLSCTQVPREVLLLRDLSRAVWMKGRKLEAEGLFLYAAVATRTKTQTERQDPLMNNPIRTPNKRPRDHNPIVEMTHTLYLAFESDTSSSLQAAQLILTQYYSKIARQQLLFRRNAYKTVNRFKLDNVEPHRRDLFSPIAKSTICAQLPHIMSGNTADVASASIHDKVNGETLYAIRDPASPGRNAFVRFEADGHLHRGLAYPVIQVADPGDEESVQWCEDITGVVEFHNPKTLHKVIQFYKQDQMLEEADTETVLKQLHEQSHGNTNIGLGSVVLAHVNARMYAIATVRLDRQVHKNNKKTKPYQVQYLDPKLREKQKFADKTFTQVKPMTLDSPCLLQGTSLAEAFPTLSEEETAIRETKAKAKSSAASQSHEVPKASDDDSVSAETASSTNTNAEVNKSKKRSSPPSDNGGSKTAPPGKRRKTVNAPVQSVQNKMAIMSILNPTPTNAAAGNQNQAVNNTMTAQPSIPAAAPSRIPRPLPDDDYFDPKLGCQFIEVNSRLALQSVIKSLEDFSSSAAKFQQTIYADRAIARYKRHYADLIRDGNIEKAKAFVETDAKTTRTQLCLRQRQYNFKWDVEAFEEITGARLASIAGCMGRSMRRRWFDGLLCGVLAGAWNGGRMALSLLKTDEMFWRFGKDLWPLRVSMMTARVNQALAGGRLTNMNARRFATSLPILLLKLSEIPSSMFRVPAAASKTSSRAPTIGAMNPLALHIFLSLHARSLIHRYATKHNSLASQYATFGRNAIMANTAAAPTKLTNDDLKTLLPLTALYKKHLAGYSVHNLPPSHKDSKLPVIHCLSHEIDASSLDPDAYAIEKENAYQIKSGNRYPRRHGFRPINPNRTRHRRRHLWQMKKKRTFRFEIFDISDSNGRCNFRDPARKWKNEFKKKGRSTPLCIFIEEGDRSAVTQPFLLRANFALDIESILDRDCRNVIPDWIDRVRTAVQIWKFRRGLRVAYGWHGSVFSYAHGQDEEK
ncbi:uncharacterized protein MYCFIDRAFT_171085 [Pseudocercospora fijiensis CIRAD86]|uniref:Uncharacterized protein n=1 Tax=Pseudocercospora fijiensis (strain CIRAD86) TaxID=383855 RepID=N1QBU7_PSEFD|nr:uncharacterized protein MYCFIDRAFT_171085 [Pseudocercospora fijiensis CIRAD86]EME89666.1 hypothetical protein MYCFIDRAFT_171085 [Pseudocercospora fijiensis CIRAD86]